MNKQTIDCLGHQIVPCCDSPSFLPSTLFAPPFKVRGAYCECCGDLIAPLSRGLLYWIDTLVLNFLWNGTAQIHNSDCPERMSDD